MIDKLPIDILFYLSRDKIKMFILLRSVIKQFRLLTDANFTQYLDYHYKIKNVLYNKEYLYGNISKIVRINKLKIYCKNNSLNTFITQEYDEKIHELIKLNIKFNTIDYLIVKENNNLIYINHNKKLILHDDFTMDINKLFNYFIPVLDVKSNFIEISVSKDRIIYVLNTRKYVIINDEFILIVILPKSRNQNIDLLQAIKNVKLLDIYKLNYKYNCSYSFYDKIENEYYYIGVDLRREIEPFKKN